MDALKKILPYPADEVIRCLEPLVTPQRKAKIEEVIASRTRHVSVVCDRLRDRGNIHAVMRTAESFGVLPFYVVDWDKDFRRANRAAKGSDQWLEIERFRESRDAIKRLRGQGYKIYVSHLNEHSCELHELDFSQPSALVFGNENEGVHEDWVREADFVFRIPMRGFTQSYNTSVAAAISLTQVFKGSEGSFKSPKSLNSKEKELLRAFYYFRSVRRVGSILKNEILKKKLGKPAKGDLCT